MTEQQRRIYELCAASHDRMMLVTDGFGHAYRRGYADPDCVLLRRRPYHVTSLAAVAQHAGRDRRRHEQKQTSSTPPDSGPAS